MARRGRSRSNPGSSADTIDNASLDLDGLLEPLPALPVDPVSTLDNFLGPSIPHDQRAFSLDMEPVHGSPSSRSNVVASPYSVQVVQNDSVRAAVCVRRSQRREVLFAMRRHGKGSGRKKQRTWKSDIPCR